MNIFGYFCSVKLARVSLVFIAISSATAAAYSQDEVAPPISRKDFVKKCSEKFGDPIQAPKHASKELIQLIKDLETEADPVKRKNLEVEKKVEMEKFLDKTDKSCNKMADSLFK